MRRLMSLLKGILVILTILLPVSGSAQSPMTREVGDRLVDIKKCIDYLEKTGNLVRVKSEVDPLYELAGIAKQYEGKKCILFEKVKGSAYPVFMGLLWNREIIGTLFKSPKEKVPFVIAGAIGSWRKDKSALSPRVLEKGPANEVIVTQNVQPLRSAHSDARPEGWGALLRLFRGCGE